VHLVSPRASRRLLSLHLLRRTLRAALAERPDVLHCFKPIGYSGAVAALAGGLGRVAGWRGRLALDTDDLEGSQGWAAAAGRPRWQCLTIDWQERWAMAAADLVTAASLDLRVRASQLRRAGSAVLYLPNGTVPPALAPPRAGLQTGERDSQTLLLYCRFNEFEPVRGADAIAAILLQAPRARLLVVGAGSTCRAAAFFRRLESRGVGKRATWRGMLRGQELADALSADSVAIWLFDDNPINRARSPAKLLELLANGKPVAAESVGEVARLPPSVVRAAPAGDPAGIVRATLLLLTETDTRLRLAQDARTYAATCCTWQHRAADLERFYCT
jgi:hypothetical protein